MFDGALGWILVAGLAAFLIASVTAPLATLAWWAGRPEDDRPWRVRPVHKRGEPPAPTRPGAPRFIVYLGGVNTLDGDSHTDRERRFLDALGETCGEAVLVRDLFPYAVTGEPLLHNPGVFRWMWRALRAAPEAARPLLLDHLVNARNFFQMLVSADRRYGPVFNTAVAEVILDALHGAGWEPGSGAAVTLIGYSGGAQMAAGAADYLDAQLDGPIDLIALGGVMASPDGLARLRRIDHIVGARDGLPRMAAAGCPGRWPSAVGSAWNEARRSGRLRRIVFDGVRHAGASGYLGEAGAPANWERTLDAVCEALRDAPGSREEKPGLNE
ncbi:hypothetical protein DDZ18_04875 [Marinicauda salina]|uniref:Alpha/beta hydrolase n=1 Tax=Marinicauda salina TaxID=2135793 RepID=A0A2U2BV66_9PROT|nr:hypothetical protein [Marinicauda salina]PWE17913.1 hypothetical protein DDZ18_04875 [Marinicauda salina]